MKSRAQTTVELLIILAISLIILLLIYSIYAQQLEAGNFQREQFLAKNSLQKIVNSANKLSISGVGSRTTVDIEFSRGTKLDETIISGNTILVKLSNDTEVFGVADVNFEGSLRDLRGKQVINLEYDGDSVLIHYNDFEVNQTSISFSTLTGNTQSESITIRNLYSDDLNFYIEKNFNTNDITFTTDPVSDFNLARGEVKTINLNFIVKESAIGNYSGNIKIIAEINDQNISKQINLSAEILDEFRPLIISPKSSSFSALHNTIVTKSYNVCNRTLNDINEITWEKDGNFSIWFTLPSITSVATNECVDFDLNINVPDEAKFDYNATFSINYLNGSKTTAYIDAYITPRTTNISEFRSVKDNTLKANYNLSSYIKDYDTYFTSTGELDHNLLRNISLGIEATNNSSELSSSSKFFDYSLVALWHLNGDAVDSSGNGNNGTVNGATSTSGLWDTDAYAFDGDSIVVENSSSLEFLPTDSFSISLWVNTTSTSSAGIISKMNTSQSFRGYDLFFNSNGVITTHIIDSWNTSALRKGSNNVVNDGKWNHILMSYDGSKSIDGIEIYINGSKESSNLSYEVDNGSSMSSINPTSDFRIGGRSTGSNLSSPFNGKIEEVIIWNKELTEKEVEELFLEQAGDFLEPNLVARFNLNGNANDSSGNGNDGVWVGSSNYQSGLWDTNAAVFDGSTTRIDVADSSQTDLQGSITLSAWINPNDCLGTGDGRQEIATKRSAYYMNLDTSCRLNYYWYGLSNPGYHYTDSSVSLNKWSFVTSVYDSVNDQVRLYINGVLEKQVNSISGVGDLSDFDLTIGANIDTGGTNRNFDGKIEDVSIWNSALSDEEVKRIYANQAGTYVEPNLVAKYELNGDIVDRIRGVEGTNNGATVSKGLFGTESFEFDAQDDYIDLGSPIIDTEEFTVSIWAKYYGTGGGTVGQNVIFQQRDDTGGNNHSAITMFAEYSGESRASVRSSNGSGNTIAVPAQGANKWHHYVFSVNSSELKLYINGVLQGTEPNTQSGNYTTSIDYVDLGRHVYSSTTAGLFNGKIDEVSFWDRSLNDEEIIELYNKSVKNFRDNNLVAYYKFNESAGDQIYDSAYDKNATLVNGASILENGMWDSNALNLDGIDDYVKTDLVLNNNIGSISSWFKTNQKGVIFSNSAEDGDTVFYIFVGNDSTGSCSGEALTIVTQISGDSTRTCYIPNDENELITNKWNNIVVNAGDDYELFINGEEKNLVVGSGLDGGFFGNSNTDNVLIGATQRNSSGISNNFVGQIDEVKIYDRVLTDEEIITDYNSFLESKFVDKNIIDANNLSFWSNAKINEGLKYNFGTELETFIDFSGQELDNNFSAYDDLVALYHLNGNINDSYGANDGSVTGAVVEDGLYLTSAYKFENSSDRITVNGVQDEMSATNGTVSAWAYPTGIGSNRYVFQSVGSSTNRYYIQYTGGRFRVIRGNPATVVELDVDVELNKWYHLVLTWDDTNLYGYIDGELKGTDIYSNPNSDFANNNVYIGTQGTDKQFLGNIDEVAFFNRKLSDEEVLELYKLQKPGEFDKGLVAHYKLNENVIDNSGNNNSLSNNGASSASGILRTNAYSFNGVDLSLSSSSPLVQAGDFTVCNWFKKNDFSKTLQMVTQYLGADAGRFGYGFNQNSNNIYFRIGAIAPETNFVFEESNWYHTCITKESSNMSLYIDGELNSTDSSSADVYQTNTLIGDIDVASTDSEGIIDEVAIWNRALSSEEIKKLYRKYTNEIDLNFYSCSDSECETKTSNVYLEKVNNDTDLDISNLESSRYLGYEVYFKQVDELVNNNQTYFTNSLIENIRIDKSSMYYID
jgi:hypothetical protein